MNTLVCGVGIPEDKSDVLSLPSRITKAIESGHHTPVDFMHQRLKPDKWSATSHGSRYAPLRGDARSVWCAPLNNNQLPGMV